MTRRRLPYLAPALGMVPMVAVLTLGSAAAQDSSAPEPDAFTSAFRVTLGADQVPGGGEPGATGTFDLRLNSDLEVLCYDIVLRGVTPPFTSPARTATHLHQGAPGAPGPARIVFPDPTTGDGATRSGSGCLSVPTTVGLVPDGATADAGAGFSLRQVEADPTAFYGDNHTSAFAPGAVRGQLTAAVPVGGVAAGFGGSSGQGPATLPLALAAGAVLALGGAVVAVRRARA